MQLLPTTQLSFLAKFKLISLLSVLSPVHVRAVGEEDLVTTEFSFAAHLVGEKLKVSGLYELRR